MSTYIGNDPFEAAGNATLKPRVYFGQLSMLAGFCVLQKGIGRLPFDAQVHKLEDRRTEIKLELTALPEHDLKFPLLRELIAESREWAGIVLPSIKKLGLSNPRELNDRWCSLKLVPTGRTYVDAASGETREATTIQLVALYADEAACRQAYQALNGAQNSTAAPTGGATPAIPPTPPNTPPSTTAPSNPERVTAGKFLAAVWKQANGDLNTLAQKIAAMPLLNKYFTLDSPEVIALVTGAPA